MVDVSTRGLEITVQQKLVTETCCNCGMIFAMTADHKARLLEGATEKERSFYCPAGHAQHYTGENEAQKLRRERDRLKQQVTQKDDEIKWQRDAKDRATSEAEHQRHRADGYKGQATKLRKRAAAGVCPCCNRSFENLRRHMESKHPKFEPVPIEGGKTV